MASQPIASTALNTFSFVRGYHAYSEEWQPWIGQVLPLERELTNPGDCYTMAIKNASKTVWYIPLNIAIAPVVSSLLQRASNKGMMEVTGRSGIYIVICNACAECSMRYTARFASGFISHSTTPRVL